MSSGKWRPFYLGLNVLIIAELPIIKEEGVLSAWLLWLYTAAYNFWFGFYAQDPHSSTGKSLMFGKDVSYDSEIFSPKWH